MKISHISRGPFGHRERLFRPEWLLTTFRCSLVDRYRCDDLRLVVDGKESGRVNVMPVYESICPMTRARGAMIYHKNFTARRIDKTHHKIEAALAGWKSNFMAMRKGRALRVFPREMGFGDFLSVADIFYSYIEGKKFLIKFRDLQC